MTNELIIAQLRIMNKRLKLANEIELYKLGLIDEYSLRYRAGLDEKYEY